MGQSHPHPAPPAPSLAAAPPNRRTALVIGAGSSGLAAVQQCLEAGLEPFCCEARPGVGGAWRFDPDPGAAEWHFDHRGQASVRTRDEDDGRGAGPEPPSAMYASLRTNVPTTLMNYRGSPFPRSVGLFCRHDQVNDYLADFALPLRPYIHLDTRVVSVRHTLPTDPPDPTLPGDRDSRPHHQRRWIASYRSTRSPGAPLETRQFDCVFVANGHYSRPYIPYTEGLRTFPGELRHARWYRDADQFANQVGG